MSRYTGLVMRLFCRLIYRKTAVKPDGVQFNGFDYRAGAYPEQELSLYLYDEYIRLRIDEFHEKCKSLHGDLPGIVLITEEHLSAIGGNGPTLGQCDYPNKYFGRRHYDYWYLDAQPDRDPTRLALLATSYIKETGGRMLKPFIEANGKVRDTALWPHST